MAILIEPCPFCNSGHQHIHHHLMSHSVVCQSCKSKGPQRRVLEDAVAEWNHTSKIIRQICRDEIQNRLFEPQEESAAAQRA